MAEHHPTRSESLQFHTERSSLTGSELPSVEADVYVWCYALLVVHVKEEVHTCVPNLSVIGAGVWVYGPSLWELGILITYLSSLHCCLKFVRFNVHLWATYISLPSIRHHLSNDDCLEDNRKDYQDCSVLCCVWQLCTVICTQDQFLQLIVGLGL